MADKVAHTKSRRRAQIFGAHPTPAMCPNRQRPYGWRTRAKIKRSAQEPHAGSRTWGFERCLSLDVNDLHRDGCLSAGRLSSSQWTRNGKTTASVVLCTGRSQLILSYHARVRTGPRESVFEIVHIVHTPCRFGGSRPYFVCPGLVDGVVCGRRVVKLHLVGRYFLCRACQRLRHASQTENVIDRARRRANKIIRRAGGDFNMSPPFLPRPKGMWRRTYERRIDQAIDAEVRCQEVFESDVKKFMDRADRRSGVAA